MIALRSYPGFWIDLALGRDDIVECRIRLPLANEICEVGVLLLSTGACGRFTFDCRISSRRVLTRLKVDFLWRTSPPFRRPDSNIMPYSFACSQNESAYVWASIGQTGVEMSLDAARRVRALR